MMTGNNIRLEQTQKLAMTPELIQAIKLLQLNTQELDNYIQEQILTNPVLETEEAFGEKVGKNSEETYEKEETSQNQDTKEDYERDNFGEWGIQTERLRDWGEYDSSYGWWGTEQENPTGFENVSVHKVTLQENLLMQLYAVELPKKKRKIAEYIVESIDDNGYFLSSVKELAVLFDTKPQKIEEILSILQTFEPVGVCARDLKECLKLQLISQGVFNEKYERLLHEFMDAIADNKIAWIAKKMKVSKQELSFMCDRIRKLEPKPGRQFASSEETQYIFPDLLVEKINDAYEVMLNDGEIPTLRISSYYCNLLEHARSDKVLDEYLKDKMRAAFRLIQNIEQRNRTIVAVASAIVNRQKEFFDRGEAYLKPMTLKEIADEISVHESTVSRCINGKYLQAKCRGIYELKFFFTGGYTNTDGEQVSAYNIKKRIKEIIKQENHKVPMGDQNIAQLLEQEGICISRRTVAKYREEMNIPASSKRKR